MQINNQQVQAVRCTPLVLPHILLDKHTAEQIFNVEDSWRPPAGLAECARVQGALVLYNSSFKAVSTAYRMTAGEWIVKVYDDRASQHIMDVPASQLSPATCEVLPFQTQEHLCNLYNQSVDTSCSPYILLATVFKWQLAKKRYLEAATAIAETLQAHQNVLGRSVEEATAKATSATLLAVAAAHDPTPDELPLLTRLDMMIPHDVRFVPNQDPPAPIHTQQQAQPQVAVKKEEVQTQQGSVGPLAGGFEHSGIPAASHMNGVGMQQQPRMSAYHPTSSQVPSIQQPSAHQQHPHHIADGALQAVGIVKQEPIAAPPGPQPNVMPVAPSHIPVLTSSQNAAASQNTYSGQHLNTFATSMPYSSVPSYQQNVPSSYGMQYPGFQGYQSSVSPQPITQPVDAMQHALPGSVPVAAVQHTGGTTAIVKVEQQETTEQNPPHIQAQLCATAIVPAENNHQGSSEAEESTGAGNRSQDRSRSRSDRDRSASPRSSHGKSKKHKWHKKKKSKSKRYRRSSRSSASRSRSRSCSRSRSRIRSRSPTGRQDGYALVVADDREDDKAKLMVEDGDWGPVVGGGCGSGSGSDSDADEPRLAQHVPRTRFIKPEPRAGVPKIAPVQYNVARYDPRDDLAAAMKKVQEKNAHKLPLCPDFSNENIHEKFYVPGDWTAPIASAANGMKDRSPPRNSFRSPYKPNDSPPRRVRGGYPQDAFKPHSRSPIGARGRSPAKSRGRSPGLDNEVSVYEEKVVRLLVDRGRLSVNEIMKSGCQIPPHVLGNTKPFQWFKARSHLFIVDPHTNLIGATMDAMRRLNTPYQHRNIPVTGSRPRSRSPTRGRSPGKLATDAEVAAFEDQVIRLLMDNGGKLPLPEICKRGCEIPPHILGKSTPYKWFKDRSRSHLFKAHPYENLIEATVEAIRRVRK